MRHFAPMHHCAPLILCQLETTHPSLLLFLSETFVTHIVVLIKQCLWKVMIILMQCSWLTYIIMCLLQVLLYFKTIYWGTVIALCHWLMYVACRIIGWWRNILCPSFSEYYEYYMCPFFSHSMHFFPTGKYTSKCISAVRYIYKLFHNISVQIKHFTNVQYRTVL